MKLHSLIFLIGEAGRNIRRNGLMSLAALGTVTVALTVLGGSLWTTFRLNEFARLQPERFNRIDLFLPATSDRSVADALQKRIEKLPNVKNVELVPKEEAWKLIQQQEPTLTQALETNPLPDKLEVELEDPTQVSSLAQQFRDHKAFSQVEKVVDAGEEVRTLVNFARIIKIVGGGLSIGLFVATLFIIHNTIRLTVFARRREVRIMQMVGATPGFIRLPLLLEGLFHGTIGGIIAGVLVLLCGREVSLFVTSLKSPLVGNQASLLSPAQIFVLITLMGACLGVVGSFLAIRRFVRQI